MLRAKLLCSFVDSCDAAASKKKKKKKGETQTGSFFKVKFKTCLREARAGIATHTVCKLVQLPGPVKEDGEWMGRG